MIRSFTVLLLLLIAAGNVTAQNSKPKASINHIGLFVMDCKKSTAFYRDIIGLDTIPEPFHDGKHTWFRIGPASALHIIEGSESKKEYYKNNHICFTVNSVEDFTAALKKNKIEFEDRDGGKNMITTRVDKVKQIWLKDPDGYWVEINDAKE